MKPPPIPWARPAGNRPAGYAAAAIAAAGALSMQAAWSAVWNGWTSQGLWQLPVLVVAATGFLVANAIFHLRSASHATWREGAILGLACDLAVGSAAGLTMVAGHTTNVLREGLWIVPPVLLAACATSAVAGALAWGGDAPAARGGKPWLRIVLAAIVVMLLGALHFTTPDLWHPTSR